MPTQSNKPLIAVGGLALVLIVMLLLGAGLAAWSTTRTLETLRRVDHTRQVRLELERILVGVVSAEGALRGYLYTREAAFLELIDRSLSDGGSAYRTAHSLTQDNPTQQRRLEALSTAIDEETEAIRHLTSTEAVGTLTTQVANDAVRSGEAKLDVIRTMIRELEEEEDRILAQRSAAARKASSETGILVAGGTLIAVALVIFTGIVLWRDVQARRRAAADILLARKYADSIVDTVREGLAVLDGDMRLTRANPSFYELFKASSAETQGRLFGELAGGAFGDPALMKQLNDALKENREFRDREVEKNFAGLGHRVLSVSARRLQGWDTGGDGLLVAIEDITERKRSEQQVLELNGELQKRASQLQAANVELEAFSYSVSHDLRAPLRHIDGFSDMLRKHTGSTLDAKAQRFLNTISDSAKRMGVLIDDLLLFSRMGRTEMNQSAVDLGRLVDDVIPEVGTQADSREVKWVRHPLPQVQGDRALLRQVFMNLLSNALKYSRTRDPAIVEIGTCDGAPSETVIYVKDNGVGFDMAYANKLFGVFQRLHRTNEFEGTGIGLANVRRIVSRHGGRTWAEGKVNEGATFYFSIPPVTPAARTQEETMQSA